MEPYTHIKVILVLIDLISQSQSEEGNNQRRFAKMQNALADALLYDADADVDHAEFVRDAFNQQTLVMLLKKREIDDISTSKFTIPDVVQCLKDNHRQEFRFIIHTVNDVN